MKNCLNLKNKIFLIILSSMMIMGMLIYFLISSSLPNTCHLIEQENMDTQILLLKEDTNNLNFVESSKRIESFAIQNNVMVRVYTKDVLLAEYNNAVYTTSKETSYAHTINTLDGEYQLNIYNKYLSSVDIINIAIKEMLPIFLLLTLVVSIFFSTIISYIITKPISFISKNARKIATLDFDISPPLERKDELGQLSKDVYTLSQKLETRLQELERENAFEQKQRLFFTATSHELKTPLTIIKNKVEGMLYKYGEYSNYEIYLPSTLETILHMEHMINEILITSQFNQLSLSKTDVNLVTLIQKNLQLYKEILESKDIQLDLNLEDTIINADEKMIDKVIANILGNAIKYSSIGEKIEIETTPKILSIENYGVKLTTEQVNLLCEPFYRVDESRNKATGGTGLGLYLVKQILERHQLKFNITGKENSLLFEIYLDENFI